MYGYTRLCMCIVLCVCPRCSYSLMSVWTVECLFTMPDQVSAMRRHVGISVLISFSLTHTHTHNTYYFFSQNGRNNNNNNNINSLLLCNLVARNSSDRIPSSGNQFLPIHTLYRFFGLFFYSLSFLFEICGISKI